MAIQLLQSAERRRKFRRLVASLCAMAGEVMAPDGTRFRALHHEDGSLHSVQSSSGRWHCSVSYAGLPVGARLLALSVTQSRAFETCALIAIAMNCVFLALQGPPGSYLDSKTEGAFEFGFMIVFTLEVVCKCAALGVIADDEAYLRHVRRTLLA
jgi:hypothetical protein